MISRRFRSSLAFLNQTVRLNATLKGGSGGIDLTKNFNKSREAQALRVSEGRSALDEGVGGDDAVGIDQKHGLTPVRPDREALVQEHLS